VEQCLLPPAGLHISRQGQSVSHPGIAAKQAKEEREEHERLLLEEMAERERLLREAKAERERLLKEG
jgi:hypothetical protein